MSRGLGQMQRTVLDLLREDAAWCKHHGFSRRPLGLRRIAKKIAGRDLEPERLNTDHSLIESVRRAAKGLEQRGTIKTGYIWYDTHDSNEKWKAEHEGSGLHLLLTTDEWEAVPCRECTIGPCVGPVEGGLLRGRRSAEFACRNDEEDPVDKLRAILG